MNILKDKYIKYLQNKLNIFHIHYIDFKAFADKECGHQRKTLETKGGAHYYCPDCGYLERI